MIASTLLSLAIPATFAGTGRPSSQPRPTPSVQAPLVISNWRFAVASENAEVPTLASTQEEGWRTAAIAEDVFHGRLGYAWFVSTLPASSAPVRRILFESVDDNATVYLNGTRLLRHEVWNEPFEVAVGGAWREDGPNVLAILVQNTAGAGGIFGRVRAVYTDLIRLTGGDFALKLDPEHGGLTEIVNRKDSGGMNWVHAKAAWGVGWMREGKTRVDWRPTAPAHALTGNGFEQEYSAGSARIVVRRRIDPSGRLLERYTIKNEGDSPLVLGKGSVGIRTPFNDTYAGGSRACLTGRCNAHVWTGGTTSYVCALRMGAKAPHLGLVLTQGSLDRYSVDGSHSSDERGIVSLQPAAMTIPSGQSRTIAWTLFWHRGTEDFFSQAAKIPGFLRVAATRYTLSLGETTTIQAPNGLRRFRISVDGRTLTTKRTPRGQEAVYRPTALGEHTVRLTTSGQDAFLRVFVTPPPMDLIQRRVLFIARHQQRNAPGTPLDGAYLCYDNETDRQVYEAGNTDHNAGRERVGMGCLIARYLPRCRERAVARELRSSLDRYYAFVNRELTDEEGVVFGSVGRQDPGRLYNYPWVMELHVLMYRLTGDVACLRRFARTVEALYRRGGTGFYCIGLPIKEGLQCLQDAGMDAERALIIEAFKKHSDHIASNGANIPSFEVSYEQSIVAPALQILIEAYLVTHEERYLRSAKALYPLMDAFNGRQPDYRLNDVAIRHWDGFWFGKSRQYGDTFPHYWSTITGVALHDLALATGDPATQARAERIAENNLCLFRPDGRASCAYLYPETVNGNPGGFFDAWANDQDWALDNYLIVRFGRRPAGAPAKLGAA